MAPASLAFIDWARAEGLVFGAPLEEFRDRTIGFDAEVFLDSLLSNPNTREPLLPALGGLPFSLTEHVDNFLSNLNNAGITPLFAFNGLDIGCRDRKTIGKDASRAVKILDEAWGVYDQGQGDAAVTSFGKTCTYRTSHILRYLYYYLHEQGVAVITAPNNAAAQLVQMDEDGAIDAMCGSASLVVFNADLVILNFAWERSRVIFIQTSEVLKKLVLNHAQFVDLMLLSGSSILSPIPEIDNDTTANKIAAAKLILNRANQDGHLACVQAKDEEYLALFRKAKAAIKHMIVMNAKGKIGSLNEESAPQDVHEVVTTQLPHELLHYQFYGLVGSRVLNFRTRNEIFETPPLDGGNSATYRTVVQEKLRPLRTRTQIVLSRGMHRYFHNKEVELVCWFSENERQPLGVQGSFTGNPAKDAETWHVTESLLSQSAEHKSIDMTAFPLQHAITVLSNDAFAKKTKTPRSNDEYGVLKTPNGLLANTVWRFLQDRGYINSDHTLSAWGKALKAAFDQAKSDGYLGQTNLLREAEEAIFVAFELLRLDMLNSKNLFPTPPYSGAPARGTDEDKAMTLFISRIATLGSFQHSKIGYTGPLSRHLLAYHQIAASVRGALRDLVEVHAANAMMSGSVDRKLSHDEYRDAHDDYRNVGSWFPFLREPNLGLALVTKCYLDELSQPAGRRNDIRKWFNHATDIDGDIQKAFKMWGAINAGVQAADSAIVSSDVRDMFQNADEWLQRKNKNAPAVAADPPPQTNGDHAHPGE